jgi:hypothetical protein
MTYPWNAGDILTAADLNSEFGSKLPYSFGTATPTTTDSGFLWYDSNSTPAAPKFWTGSAFQALTSGKVLQVVRATDGTNRTTTSTSFVDASISVTISPTKNDSAILILWVFLADNEDAGRSFQARISDADNNALSGAETAALFSSARTQAMQTVVGYSTPATTNAVTYKGRIRSINANQVAILNASNTGQLYALEIGA